MQAKGYPDLLTRRFLHLLSTFKDSDHHPPPIYAFTDFDPDGIAIMSTYKHGSWNLSHESAQLIVPRLQWLGIQSEDVMIDRDCKGLLRLSGRDRRKAIKMLENSPVFRDDGGEVEWRREIQVMLMLNVKAEMEMLGEREGGVAAFVESKLIESIDTPRFEGGLDEMII